MPEESLRSTGIHILGDVPWGSHACIFYETGEDLLDVATAYFAAGLAANEVCVWAVSEPVTIEEARAALRRQVPDYDELEAAGQMQLIRGEDWYLPGGEFEMQRITGGWHAKLNEALARGYEGMRVSGNAFWIGTSYWKEFTEYEKELDRSLDGKKMIVLCTYPLGASRSVDLLDVARAHQITVVRRNGRWEYLETPELKRAKREIRELNEVLDLLAKPLPGNGGLTERERVTLAQIARGLSGKEIARVMGISPRTVEFHRTNLLKKIGARNTVELMRKVLRG